MIAGVGIDLVSIQRMAEKLRNASFVEKVFSVNEQAYCESCPRKEQHYAVRFAAKEAFLKATGRGLAAGYDLKNIEIIQDTSGKPLITLLGSYKEMNHREGWMAIHISLSHEGDSAMAIVIIEK
jgi:holo-[acyl-carrier protein] synthase